MWAGGSGAHSQGPTRAPFQPWAVGGSRKKRCWRVFEAPPFNRARSFCAKYKRCTMIVLRHSSRAEQGNKSKERSEMVRGECSNATTPPARWSATSPRATEHGAS